MRLKAIGAPMPIPAKAVMTANALASLATVAAVSLEAYPMAPAWVAHALSAAASTAAYLAGSAAPQMALPGGPVVPLAAVPVFLVCSSAAGIAATHLGGWAGGLLVVLASVLASMAGKVGPQQVIPTVPKGENK